METRITIGNKTWVVPSSAIQSLIGWLSANAVELNRQHEIREVISNRSTDPRQLITE